MVKSRDMLNSYFEGMTPTDIAHQYAEASSSDLPPNMVGVTFSRYPWGDGPLQMPSNISFKALRAIILDNHENIILAKILLMNLKL